MKNSLPRNVRFGVALLLLTLVFAPVIYLASQQPAVIPQTSFGEKVGIGFGLVIAVLSAMTATVAYLDGKFSSRSRARLKVGSPDSPREIDTKLAVIERKARQLAALLERVQDATGSLVEKDREMLVSQVKDAVLERAADEAFRNLAGRLDRDDKSTTAHRTVSAEMEASKVRLVASILALERRANVNLVVGSTIAIAGLVFLGATMWTFETSAQAFTAGNLQFIFLRIAFVVAIELLAYFFLRMYKSSTQDITFFQNEMSNLEARITATQLLINFGGSNAAVPEFAANLAKTDRNIVIGKDQTTVDLERSRIESAAQTDVIKVLSDIVKSRRES